MCAKLCVGTFFSLGPTSFLDWSAMNFKILTPFYLQAQAFRHKLGPERVRRQAQASQRGDLTLAERLLSDCRFVGSFFIFMLCISHSMPDSFTRYRGSSRIKRFVHCSRARLSANGASTEPVIQLSS